MYLASPKCSMNRHSLVSSGGGWGGRAWLAQAPPRLPRSAGPPGRSTPLIT